jgi:biopolymer transport protein TolR
MKISRRALRMQRHHQRGKRRADLNLIPLIDVFTVLVFFLLVHPNDGAMLPSAQKLHLPESVAEADPHRTLVITVTDRDILLQGRSVAPVAGVMADAAENIAALQTALESSAVPHGGASDTPRTEITIMADRAIPYRLLKKVMMSCSQAQYRQISLAVTQKVI